MRAGHDVHHRADDHRGRLAATGIWDDGWTAVTADGRRTAQFEHTLLVTDDGVEVLTLRPDGHWSGDAGTPTPPLTRPGAPSPPSPRSSTLRVLGASRGVRPPRNTPEM